VLFEPLTLAEIEHVVELMIGDLRAGWPTGRCVWN
jgi:hypothetical protein